MKQLVNVPTHCCGHTLDWLITNRATDVLDLTVADMLLSDHFIISFDLLLRKPGRVTKKVTSRNIRSVDMYAFRTDLRNVLECATQSESADPLSMYNTCLRQALDHHAPLVTRTVTDRTSAPWMTLEVKQAKVERRIAESTWRQSGLTVHREIYAKQRNVVSNLISKAKKDYVCEKIIDCDSSRELFRLSNQLMGTFRGTVLPSNIPPPPPPPESFPDKFSEFFVRKIELIRSSLDPDRPFPCDTVEFSGTPFAEFKLITNDFVKEVLQEMPKKSCYHDPIPTPILHDCLDEITPIVTDIVNKSLSCGVVPKCFKHALVKPLLKKANLNPNCLSNYRPVSNLPFLSKMLECIVLKQFLQHLESHSLLEPFQSAYRKCHSTETALLRVVNDLLQASDSGHVYILSLLDLSAVFDSIDHDILIRRLHTTFGCSGMVLDWFTSYLSFRTQSVLVGHASTPSALKCGVPQGSVLGPLLFTLYTQSLSTVICQSGHSYHFFADDSQLHNSSTPSDFPVLVHSLKDCIEDVVEWMSDSMLKMNHDKTELIATGTKPKISQVTLSLTPVSISGHNIPSSQSVRNLGVFIDETLSMDVHIKHLCCILFCQLRRLGKIRPFLSTDAANKLDVSFVLTRLDYCSSLLAGLPDNKLNKLQRIQNHAARIVLRKPRHVSATSLLRTLHWLPVKARIQYQIACLCFQCLSHNTMPPYLSDLRHPYQPPRTLHSLDTSLLSVPCFCLETFGLRSFSVFGPTVWNFLPLSLRKTQCFSTFKKKLKTHLFEKHLS